MYQSSVLARVRAYFFSLSSIRQRRKEIREFFFLPSKNTLCAKRPSGRERVDIERAREHDLINIRDAPRRLARVRTEWPRLMRGERKRGNIEQRLRSTRKRLPNPVETKTFRNDGALRVVVSTKVVTFRDKLPFRNIGGSSSNGYAGL